jgi:hypothetical protein
MLLSAVEKNEQRISRFTDEFRALPAARASPVGSLRRRKGASELTIDRAGGVSIVAEVHGAQHSLTKRIRAVKRPDCIGKRKMRGEPQITPISQIGRESYTGFRATLLYRRNCADINSSACSNLCNRCNLRFRSLSEPNQH